MFTGIIEELGAVARVEPHADVVRLTVRGPKVVEGVRHGDSIAVSGVCLTVVDSDAESFTADVMAQTLRMSTLDDVAEGRPVNLERAALVGDRLGGLHDSFGKRLSLVRADRAGIVIGHTTAPLVNNGDALVHVAEA